MKMWELVEQILALATEGQSFSPSLAGSSYREVLESRGDTYLPPLEVFHKWAGVLTEEMEVVGLLEGACRTEFGDELYEALQVYNGVSLFQSKQAMIDAREIRWILDQCRS
jgi:hypothetical protein